MKKQYNFSFKNEKYRAHRVGPVSNQAVVLLSLPYRNDFIALHFPLRVLPQVRQMSAQSFKTPIEMQFAPPAWN